MNPNPEEIAQVLLDLRSRNAALKRARQLEQAYGVSFYRPHWKQDRFHSVGHIKGRYCRFGNRTGKTKCGGAEDVAYAMGGRLWYREAFDVLNGKREVVRHHPGGRDHELVIHGIPQRPLKILIVCSDWDKSKEIYTNREGSYEVWGDLWQLLPFEAVDLKRGVHKTGKGYIEQIVVKRHRDFGGGESLIKIDTVESFKHASLSFESSDWDIIHFDEPPPQELFVAATRGLMDRDGQFWINATPVTEMWINDEFTPENRRIPKVPDNGIAFSKTGGTTPNRFIITATTYDNPYISREAIEEYRSGLTNEQALTRLTGLPSELAGLVYPEFIYDEHVLSKVPQGWDDFHLPPKNYTIRVWWDYHLRLPQAISFFATSPKGRKFVFDEMFDENLIDPVCKAILARNKDRFVASHEIDPYALIDTPVDGTNIQDQIAQYGMWFEPATKDLSRGILEVKKLLKTRDHNGAPVIYFSPHLQTHFFEFNRFVFDPKKPGTPKDQHNHMMENLYRATLSGLPYIEPIKDEEYAARRHGDVGLSEDLIPLRN